MKDYTGQLCGCQLVKGRDLHPASKSHETFQLCTCQNCGNEASVRKSALDAKPRSCNKCKGVIISATMRETDSSVQQIGDRYGILTIIGKGEKQNHHTYVKVQCDCGSDPFEVRLEHLKGQNNGKTISCGCLSESAGELKIRQLLEQTNLNQQKQYRIVNKDNKIMYFDFVIFNNKGEIIKGIEYNGKQHYEPIQFQGGEEAFIKQQERDKRKEEYCAEKEITLQQISYKDYDNINLDMLVSDIK